MFASLVPVARSVYVLTGYEDEGRERGTLCVFYGPTCVCCRSLSAVATRSAPAPRCVSRGCGSQRLPTG
eukprot:6098468-Prymnesium_polylepis.1